MEGLHFQTATPPGRSDPARADIACFVGFVAPRATVATQRARLDAALRQLGWDGPPLPAGARVVPPHVVPSGNTTASFSGWIETLGWRPRAHATAAIDLFRRAAAALLGDAVVEWWVEQAWLAPFSRRRAADLLELSDVPVPIDTWDVFDALFAWDERPLVEGTRRFADTTLGAAVRRFFLQGGRKCYVVRVGAPWSPFAPLTARRVLRRRLLESLPEPTPVDRTTWRGVGHLFGLTDVSFLCLPDIPELFSIDVAEVAPESESEGEERFIECATRVDPPAFRSLRAFPTPRCSAEGFQDWARFVGDIASLLERRCREVQLIAAVPLPADESALRGSSDLAALQRAQRPAAIARRLFASRAAQWTAAGSIQTAFAQLAYPWLRTRESSRLPGALEAPDAMLAGVLANNALTMGTWRSAAREPVAGLIGIEPVLSLEDRQRELPYRDAVGLRRLPRTVQERISLFAPSPTGFQLLSDVTTDDDEAYRPANVNRLVASIIRTARLVGEDAAFMNNGEALSRRLRAALEDLLLGLWGEGALAGTSSSEAFAVRCDRSTMTQADVDAGRLIARVTFNAAAPIEQIIVVFAMDEGGQVTLVTPPTPEPAEAAP